MPTFNPTDAPTLHADDSPPPPDWRLPAGVCRGVWEYANRPHIADDYDVEFAANTLFDFDAKVLHEAFDRPGVLVDLGCGTGRTLLPFARRGYRCVGVDLSTRFLQIVGRKAAAEGLHVDRVAANLVDLGCLADETVDYASCLFSTLGMIRGRANRAKALSHVARILKPGGVFVVHVHNRWYNLRHGQARRRLFKNLTIERGWGDGEPGDTVFPYRGISDMYLHVFTRGELVRDLKTAGFSVGDIMAIDTAKRHPLKYPWLFGRLRANGWIAVCRKAR